MLIPVSCCFPYQSCWMLNCLLALQLENMSINLLLLRLQPARPPLKVGSVFNGTFAQLTGSPCRKPGFEHVLLRPTGTMPGWMGEQGRAFSTLSTCIKVRFIKSVLSYFLWLHRICSRSQHGCCACCCRSCMGRSVWELPAAAWPWGVILPCCFHYSLSSALVLRSIHHPGGVIFCAGVLVLTALAGRRI